jgi:hypothetical protein
MNGGGGEQNLVREGGGEMSIIVEKEKGRGVVSR